MTLPLLAEVLEFCPKSLQPPCFRGSLGQHIVNSQFWHYFCLKFWRSKIPRAWSTWTTQGEPKECRVINVHCTIRNIPGLKCTYKCTKLLRKMRGFLKFSELFRRCSLGTSYPGWTKHENFLRWDKIISPVTRTFRTRVSSLFQIKQEVCEGRMVV